MKSRALLGVFVVIIVGIAIAVYARRYFSPVDNPVHASDRAEVDPAAANDGGIDSVSVHLPPDKLKAAGVVLSDVTKTQLHPENNVPGRLRYDDRRHVEVRSATAGVITSVRVNPGDQVQAGDVLIELNSSEVGNARADVLLRTSELKLAIENREWEKAIFDGLAKLTAVIRARSSVEKIKQEFRDVTLGKSREQLMSAYSDLLLAESLVNAVHESAKSGIVPTRLVEERINSRDNAEATLQAALEDLTFTAKVNHRTAETRVEDAERRLKISLQAVQTLLGHSSADEKSVAELEAEASADPLLMPESLSLVQLRAPFAGTIERRTYSPSERVAAGDGMLTLADTSTLWVAADLREREWHALSLKPGDAIRVETSIPGMESLTAKVHFVGREVDPRTNAIPLIAVLDNSSGNLRPGMFVRVAVPVAESRDAVTVPESSVLEHDRQAFVFSPTGDSDFRRINIIPGIRVGGLVEVVTGLSLGERVVSGGGFYLKSEMLLEGEE
ncbi:MAG TPA: efflux RND transporter periplasmic adaptor subunit [Planctomycetaceae bacterium]|mgnify:CR=1 FL=1|nr:efflux RND transporter periplasmic adaptor subunit [Planctomycetaceae bacterium]